ncbi:MAG TPA: polysaccharide pyruvyl transferase family protein [Gemmatimonadaceae bacterium]|nr:polysaccharide pyruvyl transferase family protein [Gemmatimonadaceae bacterium]
MPRPDLASLRATIDDVLRPIISDARRVALLDFPAHSNVGDSAIWLGTLACLRQHGKTICYSCDQSTYSRSTLAERLGDGVILLSGGGNFGDIWKHSQHLREQVVRDFPHARIVQLPQSVMFRDPGELARARAIFDAHPDLTLLVRDRRSLRFVSENFRAPAFLCPDMALCLGPIARPSSAKREIVWLARTDRESAGEPLPTGIATVDWLHEPRAPGLRLESFLREIIVDHPRAERSLRNTLSRVADGAAAGRLRRGCAMLSEGRVVVTDRLHAHILSLLLGIPSVIIDNSYGKLRNFYETWTCGNELAALADGPEQAMSLAMELAS